MSKKWMQYVKTSGLGFTFTDSEFEAMHFGTKAEVFNMRDRLAPQFPNYVWEVVRCSTKFCLVVLLCGEQGCTKLAAEVRRLIQPDRSEKPWPVCEEHAKYYDGLGEALMGSTSE
ncbi:MAG: hypothetical protein ACLPND_07750 [Candidatus Korobacteraceae bacterium]